MPAQARVQSAYRLPTADSCPVDRRSQRRRLHAELAIVKGYKSAAMQIGPCCVTLANKALVRMGRSRPAFSNQLASVWARLLPLLWCRHNTQNAADAREKRKTRCQPVILANWLMVGRAHVLLGTRVGCAHASVLIQPGKDAEGEGKKGGGGCSRGAPSNLVWNHLMASSLVTRCWMPTRDTARRLRLTR